MLKFKQFESKKEYLQKGQRVKFIKHVGFFCPGDPLKNGDEGSIDQVYATGQLNWVDKLPVEKVSKIFVNWDNGNSSALFIDEFEVLN